MSGLADTLNIFGTTFSNVTGIIATNSSDTDLTYIRPQGTKSITTNGNNIDVAEYASVNVAVSSSSPTIDSLTVTPSTSQQTFNSSSVDGYKPVTVNAMSTGSVTAPSTISGTSASVSTGTNTLTLSKTVSVTPNVTTAGYISSGTAGNSSVSLTASVTTKAAATYNTSSSDQTIASGTYLTGAQTIKAVTVSGLSAGNIADGVTVKVGDANDDDRIASVTGTLAFVTYRTGTSDPSSSLGSNGDIYLKTVS